MSSNSKEGSSTPVGPGLCGNMLYDLCAFATRCLCHSTTSLSREPTARSSILTGLRKVAALIRALRVDFAKPERSRTLGRLKKLSSISASLSWYKPNYDCLWLKNTTELCVAPDVEIGWQESLLSSVQILENKFFLIHKVKPLCLEPGSLIQKIRPVLSMLYCGSERTCFVNGLGS